MKPRHESGSLEFSPTGFGLTRAGAGPGPRPALDGGGHWARVQILGLESAGIWHLDRLKALAAAENYFKNGCDVPRNAEII